MKRTGAPLIRVNRRRLVELTVAEADLVIDPLAAL
jgi:hypothetical protein